MPPFCIRPQRWPDNCGPWAACCALPRGAWWRPLRRPGALVARSFGVLLASALTSSIKISETTVWSAGCRILEDVVCKSCWRCRLQFCIVCVRVCGWCVCVCVGVWCVCVNFPSTWEQRVMLQFGYSRGVWHLHPTTLNEAVDASGRQDLIRPVYLHGSPLWCQD